MTQNLGELFAGEQKKLSETSRNSKQLLIATIDREHFPLAGERVRTQDTPDSFLMLSSSKIPSPQFTENCPAVACIQLAFSKSSKDLEESILSICVVHFLTSVPGTTLYCISLWWLGNRDICDPGMIEYLGFVGC